ncbi:MULTISPECIES: hypothetical protein [unclassified Robiginitalea]|uniref:hypothetical protein n=1 Tax=Robiginitalea TaxID=252306 RepID=UPI00234B9EFF|nr:MULTISPECIES: hypothetical protein [unclassified Robiginitalea]MDC6355733.1 hypothetical protein [Robiginitalea sp. PM2]MDC6376142.1 hypothetical protein [Robiginitalea sp. SP8]
MIEFRAIASNSRYMGTTEFYCNIELEELIIFGQNITMLPNDIEEVVFNSGGSLEDSNFSISLRQYELTGKIECLIRMTENLSHVIGKNSADKISMSFISEPASIDNFAREFFDLLENKNGKSILVGN